MTPTTTVILPVGIEKNGSLYKEVQISEMNGFDEENMSSRAVKNNGAKAQTMLLRRCIQAITGLVGQKSSPNILIDEEIIRSMTSYDRDFLFFNIRMLGGNSDIEFAVGCNYCGASTDESMTIEDLDVYEWPENEKQTIDIELLRGLTINGKQHNEFKWRFLTGKDQERLARLDQNRLVGASLAYGCCGFNTDDDDVYNPTEDDFRRLTSETRLDAMTQIAENAPGIQNVIQVECSGCERKIEHAIDVSLFFARKEKQNRSARKTMRVKRVKR